MKVKAAFAVAGLLIGCASVAQTDDVNLCLMQGYASASPEAQFYSRLLLRLEMIKKISFDPRCTTATQKGKEVGVRLENAFMKNQQPNFSPQDLQLMEDFAAFSGRIDEFILRGAGLLK